MPLWFGQSDPPIPVDPPDEHRRVHHPKGFSIVPPPNWRVRFDSLLTPSIGFTPRMGIPLRRPVGISVRQLGVEEPETSSDYRPVDYQGLPARERQAVERIVHEGGPQFIYTLIVRREECWYAIQYCHSGQIESLPEMVRQYLLTFRVDDRLRDRQPPDPIPPRGNQDFSSR